MYDKDLNNKDKQAPYKTFRKEVGFKKYLHGVSDAGSRLLFKFKSGHMGCIKSWIGIERGEGKWTVLWC